MSRTLRPLLLSLFLLVPACSHAPTGQTGPRASNDLITEQEIRANSAQNVYDLIAVLRFRWLQPRGTDTVNLPPGGVMARMDNNELGTVQTLHSVPTSGITSIRFYDPITAAGRWGLGYAHGAVVISTGPTGATAP